MIYENNAELRGLLRRGVSSDAVHELLSANSFVLADVDFDAALAEVKAQHALHNDTEAQARAAYRLLTKTKAPDAPVVARHSIFSKCFWSAHRVWIILRVAWAIAILLTLLFIAARPAHGQSGNLELRTAAFRSRLGRGFPDVPGGIIIQVSNQGTLLATRPAGLLKFDCQSGMSCSFSGVTFALTATGSGGGVNVQVNGGANLASPVNFQNGSAVTGVAINFSNPSGSNVQAAISGTLTDAGLASAYSGVGTCTNQSVTSLARNAAPTCSNVTGSFFANQNANVIFAGPSSGSAAAPAFRSMVPADIFHAVNAQTGAGYTITAGDQCKLVTFSNASGQTVNLPGTVPAAGWCVFLQNTGAGTVTFSPNGHNLDGSANNLNMDVHDGLLIVSDGSNYFSLGGAGRRTTVSQAASDTLCNFACGGGTNITTTETAFANSYTVKNGSMFTGRALNAHFCGVITNTATATNILWNLRWGTASGTIIWGGTSSTTGANSRTNQPFCLSFVVYGMSAVGSSATVDAYVDGGSNSGGSLVWQEVPATQPPVTVATNADKVLVLTITYANTTNNESVTIQNAKFWWDN